ISDHWLYGQTTILDDLLKTCSFTYTDRILARIRAKVSNFPEPSGVEVSHEIWTPDRTDVRAAVERIWGSDHREDLLKEAEWFEEQARPHLVQIAVLDGIAGRLRASRIRVAELDASDWQVIKLFHEWLNRQDLGFPVELCVRATKQIIGDFE